MGIQLEEISLGNWNSFPMALTSSARVSKLLFGSDVLLFVTANVPRVCRTAELAEQQGNRRDLWTSLPAVPQLLAEPWDSPTEAVPTKCHPVSHHMEPVGAVPQLLAATAFRREPPQSKWWWDRARACIILLMSLGTFQLSSSQQNKLPAGTAKARVAISRAQSLAVMVPSTFPSAAAAVSTRCFHLLWAGLSWDHLVSHFSESHFSPVMFLVSCSPQRSKDRRREAQRDNVYSSEILEVPRRAIASRVAGGKPNWSQQPFSSTGVSCTRVTWKN